MEDETGGGNRGNVMASFRVQSPCLQSSFTESHQAPTWRRELFGQIVI